MSRGRPRDPSADAAIERAIRELLIEVGYRKTSMQKIAQRSGVAKTTVYRRAPDKASLLFEMLFGREPSMPDEIGPDWVSALKQMVGMLSEEFTDPVARVAMPGLFAEFSSRPELAHRMREELLQPAYIVLGALLEDGRRRGEVTRRFDEVLWMDALFGAVFVRALIFDRPVGREVTDPLVDMALAGICDRS